MTVTVSAASLQTIHNCDATTNSNAAGVDTVDFKQNSASLYWTLKASGNNDATFTWSGDLSGTKHVRFWGNFVQGALINLKASGGIQLGLSDGTNTGYWYIDGRDTYQGGWRAFVCDVSRAVDNGTKPTMSSITQVIIRINLTGSGKNFNNTWIDMLCATNGLIAYGDDSGSYFDMEDIFVADDTDNSSTVGGWGVVTQYGGVYFMQGALTIGDAAGSNGCKFQPQNQTIVFRDVDVEASTYAITVVDNGTGTTECLFGSKSGTAGINGCTITAAGTADFDIVATDTDISDFALYGCTIIGAGSVSLPAAGSTVEALNTSFIACGQVDPSSCTVTNCNFISSTATTTGAVLFDNTSAPSYMTYCNFIACTYGVQITTAGTYDTVTGLIFTNCTTDLNNTSGGSVTWNNVTTSGSNASTYTGSTTINSNVALTITVLDLGQTPISGVQTSVHLYNSPFTELMNEDTNTGGIADASYNYPGSPVDIVWKTRKSDDLDDPRYKPRSGIGQVSAQGFTLTVILEEVAVPI